MNKLVILAKTLRLPNLLLLAFAQFLVSHYFLKDYNIQLLILISSATLSIALAGYLLNDIFDLTIDKANNKLKFINEKNKNWALLFSVFLFSIGLIFGFLSSQLSAASFL
jgi:4-hydroxybenzoate polyprenyltransferase